MSGPTTSTATATPAKAEAEAEAAAAAAAAVALCHRRSSRASRLGASRERERVEFKDTTVHSTWGKRQGHKGPTKTNTHPRVSSQCPEG